MKNKWNGSVLTVKMTPCVLWSFNKLSGKNFFSAFSPVCFFFIRFFFCAPPSGATAAARAFSVAWGICSVNVCSEGEVNEAVVDVVLLLFCVSMLDDMSQFSLSSSILIFLSLFSQKKNK